MITIKQAIKSRTRMEEFPEEQMQEFISGKSPYDSNDQTYDTGTPRLTNLDDAAIGVGKSRSVPEAPAGADVSRDRTEKIHGFNSGAAVDEEDAAEEADRLPKMAPPTYLRNSTFSNDESEMGGFNIPDTTEARKIRNSILKIPQAPIADRNNYHRQPVL